MTWPSRLPRPRLLPVLAGAMVLLTGVKLQSLLLSGGGESLDLPPVSLVAPARAVGTEPPGPAAQPRRAVDAAPAPPAPAPAAAPPAPEATPALPSPEQAAERAVLESLRARRAELEAREQASAAREMVVAAAERRLAQRIEELAALQRRVEATERAATEREEAGWRQMVKLYEGMRPRDAASIFDELDMPVLVRIVDRMADRKAAPVLGAMRPERARQLTAELARLRARPAD
jgi:flagellar motility protein MotE (MotC chaperone)